MAKHGRLGLAATRAGMDRKTAHKYVKEGKFPSELEQERTWRTRADPFEEQWASLAERLKAAPELEAKTLFEELCTREPGRYKPGSCARCSGECANGGRSRGRRSRCSSPRSIGPGRQCRRTSPGPVSWG